ncbi:MAG: amidohydrolase [Nanoarchaeota archaeon]|nr:amidohydrolase [Nanoarchaeota archaeon]
MIDIHTHTEFSPERLMKIHRSFEQLDLGKENFLEDVENLGIEYVLSIGKMDGVLRSFFDETKNASLEELVNENEKYPFLKRVGSVSLDKGGNLKLLRDYFENDVIVAMKIYLGYTTDDPDSELLNPYYDVALEFDKPVLFHMGKCYPKSNPITVSPSDVIPVLEKYPDQRFVLCHFGHPLIYDTEEILIKYDNAFTDLSGLMTYEDTLNGEKEPRLKRVKPVLERLLNNPKTMEKVMYGSDYPLMSLKQYFSIIDSIVPDDMKDKVFYDNAKNFFRL